MTRYTSKRAFKGILTTTNLLLCPILAATAQQDSGAVHDLDPFLVEAGDDAEAAQQLELRAGGRLELDAFNSNRTNAWLSSADLLASGAGRIEDLFWRMPGAVEQARFGVVTVPTIRGDAAETLFNGQRRGDNLFGLPLTFTNVESIEVLAGPAPVSSGVGKRTGGFLNITTRRPVTGTRFGMLDMRLGTLLPGGDSYRSGEVTVDLNVPLSGQSALRVAAGFRDDETFYEANGARDDYRDLYTAWRRQFRDGAQLDLIFAYQEYDRPQTLGVNRPWQGLIDDNLYFTGMVDAETGQADPPGPLDPGVADPGLLVGGPDKLVKLDRDRILLSRSDTGSGEALLGQLIWSRRLGSDLRFSQKVLGEQVYREKENQFFYAEDVEQDTLDSISQLEGTILNRLGPLQWEAGLQLRIEDRDNRTNYWNEFAYAFDITEGRQFSAYGEFPSYIAPGAVSGEGDREWYLPSSPFSTPETTTSTLRQAGVFGQALQELGAGWSFTAGARVDWFDIEAAEPSDLAGGTAWSDRKKPRLLSGSISIRKQWARGSLYAAAVHYRGIAGNTVGDGINLYAPGELLRYDFLNRSRLLEAGGRWQVTEGLFLSGSVYHQTRTRREFFGPNDIRSKGMDLELEWQVTARTRIEGSLHFLDARYDNASPAEFGGGSLWNVYAAGEGPTSSGNGLGYIGGFFLNSLPPADYRVPGLPRWTLGAGLEHDLTRQLSLRIWGTWQSSIRGNLAGEWEIPSQTEWNASLRYTAGRWDCLLVARNLLDAENWIHNGDTFFNQMLVSRNLPLRLEGRIRIRF